MRAKTSLERSIRSGLHASDINAYTEEGYTRKKAFHHDGRAFLKQLAESLGLTEGTYEIRITRGGVGTSGEVTLHTDRLYVRLVESWSCTGAGGVGILYRSCRSRKDYIGGANHWELIRNLTTRAGYENFFSSCRQLMESYQ